MKIKHVKMKPAPVMSLEKQPDDLPDRALRAVVSKEVVDADGEVLLLQGADLSRWRRNPLFLRAHMIDFPIGHGLRIWQDGDDLIADLQFSGSDNPDAEDLLQKYRRNEFREFSVGFGVFEERAPTQKDFEQFDPDGNALVNVISKWVLLEISAVPIGSNPGTRTLDVKALLASQSLSEGDHEPPEDAAETPQSDPEPPPRQKLVLFRSAPVRRVIVL